MLAHSFLLLSLSALLSGGDVHGVVVDKSFKPLPLAHSLGVDGIYHLSLRDEKNHLHRQMVTREIFERYQIGDQFSERPTSNQKVAHQMAVTAPVSAVAPALAASAEPTEKRAFATTEKPSAAKLATNEKVAPPKAVALEKPSPAPKPAVVVDSRALALQKHDMLADSEDF